MVLRISKIACLVTYIALLQLALVSGASADERITDDYIALVFEAEHDDNRDERWVLMNASTPAQENDPDANHSDGAVGGAYIELLPDIRVTHEDEFGPPEMPSIWHQPSDDGPVAYYTMNFPEAGRYYVHIRAFSTGTEDNGIHVGVNNDWPLSGRKMQFCSAGKGWTWSGKQRDSGGAGSCGVKKTIWITVPEAGVNTFKMAPREDGFEADRIMLIKDLSDNTRICSPSGEDGISCVNGTLENVDDIVDMAVTSMTSATEIGLESSVLVSVVVRNEDGYDSAEDVVLTVGEGIGNLWDAVELPAGCEVDGSAISCDLGTVTPSNRGEEGNTEFEFTFEPLQSGTLEIPVSVATSSVDGDQDNDFVSPSVTVADDESSLSSLSLQIADENLTWQSNVETRVVATASNSGPGDAESVVLSISVPVGLTVGAMPTSCVGTTNIQCSFDSVAASSQVSVEFGITPTDVGLYSVSVAATASNHNGATPANTIIVRVEDDTADVDTTQVNTTDGDTTEVEVDTGDVTNVLSKKSGGGALVWWTLMLLTLALYMRQIHVARVGRRMRLTASSHIS